MSEVESWQVIYGRKEFNNSWSLGDFDFWRYEYSITCRQSNNYCSHHYYLKNNGLQEKINEQNKDD